MKNIHFLLPNVVIAFSTFSFPGIAKTDPGLSVKKISWAGTGCPATASGTAVIENVDSSLSIPVPAFSVKPPEPGKSLRDMRKNCSLQLDLEYAKSMELRLVEADLEVGSKGKAIDALVRVDSRFQGESTANFQDLEVKAAKASSRQGIKLGGSTWSKCGERKSLMVQIQARLNKIPAGEDAKGVELAVNGPLKLKLEWRECQVAEKK